MGQVWPEEQYPLIPVGKMVLNENITNFFNETEVLAVDPGITVPGMTLCWPISFVLLSIEAVAHARVTNFVRTAYAMMFLRGAGAVALFFGIRCGMLEGLVEGWYQLNG